MALINCPECSKEISDTVKKCPHCGYNLKNKKNKENKISISNKIFIMSLSVVLAVSLIMGVGYFLTENSRTYKNAQTLFNSGNYEEASVIFTELGDYKDSATQVSECRYLIAMNYFNNNEYNNASVIFTELGDYKDSVSKIYECKYQIALSYYEKEDFESALVAFQEISNYKESKKFIDDCNYQLSVDVQFIRDLSKGLVERWKINSNNEGFSSNTDLKEFDKKLVNSELDFVGKYAELEFLDKELKQKANQYIEALYKQLEAVPYYSSDYTKYDKLWGEGYNKRAILLEDFATNYNLTVEDEYAKELEEFKDVAKTIKELEKQNDQINEMLNSELKFVSDDYGYKLYQVEITNITDITFSYFGIEVKFYNEEGTYIGSDYTDSISEFKSGDKALLSFSTFEDFADYEFIAVWSTN